MAYIKAEGGENIVKWYPRVKMKKDVFYKAIHAKGQKRLKKWLKKKKSQRTQ